MTSLPATTPSRTEIAQRLRLAGEMLRLRGESSFRAGAYEAGADALDAMTDDLAAVVSAQRLTAIPGIGPSLAATITDLVRTGHSAHLDSIMGELPPGLLELARIPGFTRRRIQVLHDRLGIASVADLRQALSSGAVTSIKGFGAGIVGKLSAALDHAETIAARVLLVEALPPAYRMLADLRGLPGVSTAEIVGSVRRWVETVGDVNLLAATSSDPSRVIRAMLGRPAVSTIITEEFRFCRFRLSTGLAVTLTVTSPERFAGSMLTWTGSRGHVDRLRARARARGLDADLDNLAAESEAAAYDRLGLPYITPELREDAGEIELAEAGDTFADLVVEEDILGMVHCHTVYSDGRNTVVEMARAAAERGMKYITITDHSPTASYAGGVKPERLPQQWRDIAQAQESLSDIRILRGTESDILPDGTLDYPPETLHMLDVVIASIHDRNHMGAAAMTERLLRAMQTPLFKIWGHALGRLLLRRDPIACDVERILDVVAGAPAAIEINGSPYRLDLPCEWVRSARRRGIPFVISTDAHSTAELSYLRFGVALARRAGVRRDEVLNARPLGLFMDAVRPRLG